MHLFNHKCISRIYRSSFCAFQAHRPNCTFRFEPLVSKVTSHSLEPIFHVALEKYISKYKHRSWAQSPNLHNSLKSKSEKCSNIKMRRPQTSARRCLRIYSRIQTQRASSHQTHLRKWCKQPVIDQQFKSPAFNGKSMCLPQTENPAHLSPFSLLN